MPETKSASSSATTSLPVRTGVEFLRRLLFRLEPERAHNLTIRLLSFAGALPPLAGLLHRAYAYQHPSLAVEAFGLRFRNPLGLAAGYDKNGIAIRGLACLGFGHLELGTVTPRPQVGNPRPRVFRLEEDRALINRMGFPNAGARSLLRRLNRVGHTDIIIGVNIGKGADTPIEEAAQDYLGLLDIFYEHADYLAVNVSSPNTIGLRRLQARKYLEALLDEMAAARKRKMASAGRRVPILVKLSPDLAEEQLEDALGAILDAGMDGVIATNTTIQRPALLSKRRSEEGGLSGAPLRTRAEHAVHRIHQITHGQLPIIGVGGVLAADGAGSMLDEGATLLQIFTGLVYAGPGLVHAILRELAERDTRSGPPSLREAA